MRIGVIKLGLTRAYIPSDPALFIMGILMKVGPNESILPGFPENT